jgi:hypothetical protein
MNTTTYKNKTNKNPAWWNDEDETAWERTKEAFRRDWDQTKHDLGGDEPDTDQQVGDTVKQATGKEAIPPRGEPTYDKVEPAYRYGYRARSHYGQENAVWDDELEARLKEEWTSLDPSRKAFWKEDRDAIRYGWEFDELDEG